MTTATISSIPALSQSLQAKMACPHLYRATQVDGAPEHESNPSVRGTQIHAALKTYIRHLVDTRQQTDVAFFDALLAGAHAGDLDDAREILEGLREAVVIDPERVLAVEARLKLNAQLEPVDEFDDDAAFAGTPDLITLPDPALAVIDDWKSYFAVIDAETFQAKFYALLAFQHYPDVQTVRFRLRFVRYGAVREVEFTRGKDLPGLRRLALATRARQVALHASADGAVALPGSHCCYCPKLTSSCPVKESNPYAEQTPEERLAFSVWARQALRQNDAVLRDFCKATGPVEYRDSNEVAYRAGFNEARTVKYPLPGVLPILDAWEKDTGERLHEKVFVGATELKSLAKAKKREALRNSLVFAEAATATSKFAVGKAGEEGEAE